ALLRRVRSQARPDLALVLASATLDVKHLAGALGDAAIVECEGRLFPVETTHRPPRPGTRVEDAVSAAVLEAFAAGPGDILCFLPGLGEIRRTAAALGAHARAHGFELVELHGGLAPAEQDRAIRSGPKRRVVLATN